MRRWVVGCGAILVTSLAWADPPPTARFDDVPPGQVPSHAAIEPMAEVVDPYAGSPEAPAPEIVEVSLENPYADVVAPEVDYEELLLVNPYSEALRAKTQALITPRFRQALATDAGSLEVTAPPGFRGRVFVNGVEVVPSTSPLPVLPGDHAIRVLPSDGSGSFTVWVSVSSGERQRVRFGR